MRKEGVKERKQGSVDFEEAGHSTGEAKEKELSAAKLVAVGRKVGAVRTRAGFINASLPAATCPKSLRLGNELCTIPLLPQGARSSPAVVPLRGDGTRAADERRSKQGWRG